MRGKGPQPENLCPRAPASSKTPRLGLDWVLIWSTVKPLFCWSCKQTHSRAFTFQLGLRSHPSCSISPKSAARGVSISTLWVWWPSVPITWNASCQGNSTFSQANRRKKKKLFLKLIETKPRPHGSFCGNWPRPLSHLHFLPVVSELIPPTTRFDFWTIHLC